jgi:hypothetical protein
VLCNLIVIKIASSFQLARVWAGELCLETTVRFFFYLAMEVYVTVLRRWSWRDVHCQLSRTVASRKFLWYQIAYCLYSESPLIIGVAPFLFLSSLTYQSRQEAKTDFESCVLRFSNRMTNMVAHKLELLVCNSSVGVIL